MQPESNLPLIAAVNHAADMLGLYRAELARILDLNCADVSDAQQLELLLQENRAVRAAAESFIVFYQLLERKFSNDTVAMVHWFRKEHASLGTTPFLAMIDNIQLNTVIELLRSSN